MPTHEGDSSPRFLYGLISTLQAALRRRGARAAALWAAAAAIVATASLLAVDAAGGLPASVRLIAYVATVAGGMTLVASAAGRAWLKRPSAFYVARLIEARRPDLKNALITFVELDCDPGADRSMHKAVARRAARALSDADPIEYLPPVAHRTPAIALAAATALLGGGLWLCQGSVVGAWVATARADISDGPRRTTAADNTAGGAGAATESGGPTTPGAPTASKTKSSQPSDGTGGKGAAAKSAGGTGKPPSSPSQKAGAGAMAEAIKADAAKFERLASALAAGGWTPPGSSGSPGSSESTGPSGAAGSSAGGHAGGASGGPGGEREPAASPGGGGKSAGTPAVAGGAAGGAGEVPGGAGHEKSGSGANSTQLAPPGMGGPARGNGAESTATSGAAAGTSAGHQPGGQGTGVGNAESGSGTSGSRGGSTGTGTSAGRGGSPSGGTGGRPPAATSGSPLENHPPSEEFPPGVLDSMRQTRLLIKEADRRLRDGEVSDAFLGRMGMSNAEFRRFVTAWQRQMETGTPGPNVSTPPDAVSTIAAAGGTGAGQVLRPTAASDVKPMLSAAASRSVGPQGQVEGAESAVSPRLKPAVSAYFEAVGRMAADGTGKGQPR